MKKLLFILILMSAIWGSAQESSPDSNFYLGVSAGMARTEDSSNCSSCYDYSFDFILDDSFSRTFSAFGGYRINRYWSAEVTYFDTDKARYRSAAFDENFNPETYYRIETEFNSWAGTVKGNLPVSSWFSFQAKAGWHFYKARILETQLNRLFQPIADSQQTLTDNDLLLGTGIEFRLNRRINLGFEVERWEADSIELTQTISNDTSFDFTTVNYSATFTYKF